MTDEDTSYEPKPASEYLPVEWVPREAIEPNDWNPNEMTDEQRERLHKSLLDNGWTQPIVIHAEDHYIVDGEQRWTVASAADIQGHDALTPPDIPAGYVPVYGITVEENHAKLATVQHNRARGDVDIESLRGYLEQLEERDVLDEVHDRIGVEDEDARLILDEVTARGIGEETDGFTPPWEPVERHEMPEDEMEEERSASIREAAAEAGDDEDAADVARASERLNFVLTPSETDIVRQALGREQRAQSLVNLVDYVLDKGLVSEVRTDFSEEEQDAARERFEEIHAEQHGV